MQTNNQDDLQTNNGYYLSHYVEAGKIVEGDDEGDLQVRNESKRINLEKTDRSLYEFYRWWKNGRLTLDPEWQRNFVWHDKKSSRLIESILVDVPIPVIYLAKNDDENYEVIDGLQRLTSVFEFFDNKYNLSGLEILKDLNGKTFEALDRKSQNKLHDATLRTFELHPSTPKDLMFVIFERLNTGGTTLNDMEIRNCLYRGDLNRLIKQLAELDEFKKCVNVKNISKRMMDRLFVLRFLAFYERTYLKATRGLKRFLNEFLEAYKNPPPEKLKEYERAFRKAMKATYTVFGENGFRLRRLDRKGASQWGLRPNMAIFQVISVAFTKYDSGQITRAADSILEEYLDLITTDAEWCDCVGRNTGNYFHIEYSFQRWQERLEKVLSGWEPNDSKRAFSRSLKKEMWDQDDSCAICLQEIKLIDDAALDHDEHYWRGGKTIPSNARLVHRLCNLKRKN